MSGTTEAAAPVATAPSIPVAAAATVAPAVPDVGAPGAVSADAAPAPAPAPDPTQQTLLDAPAAPEAPAEPAAPVDPATYEVKLPEGMTREDPMVAAFLTSAAGQRLGGETVQAVLDTMAPIVAEQLAAPQKAWTDLNAQWQADIKADPEVGGANLAASVARINGVIDRFGTPELKDALRLTGAANNPHVFRFIHKLASAYAEATPVAAGNSGHVAPPPGRTLAAMYPSARQANGAA